MANQLAPTGGSAVAPQSQPTRGILTPTNLAEAMKMAEILASSDLVPKDFQRKPGNVLIACQWGAEIGLAPLQAMQSIAVINGRPSIWGDAMLALVQGSGKLVNITEEVTPDGETATCTVIRRGKPDPVVRAFTMAEAKRAGLAGKSGTWQQYPRRMLQLRARAFALRDAFADVLRGVAIAEEARDMPVLRDVTPQNEVAEDQPKATKLRGKIAAKKKQEAATAQEAVTVGEVIAAIREAQDEAALAKAGEAAKKLTEPSEQDAARNAYREKLAELREPTAGAQDGEPSLPLDDAPAESIGVLVDRVRGWSVDDLADGAELAAILSAYAPQFEQIKAADPDAHAALMEEIQEAAAQTADA